MPGTRFAYGLSALAAAALLVSFATGHKPRAAMHRSLPAAQVRARLERRLAHAPLAFEPNFGQSADGIRYLARGRGYTLLLDASGATLQLAHGAPQPPGLRQVAGNRTSSRIRPARSRSASSAQIAMRKSRASIASVA